MKRKHLVQLAIGIAISAVALWYVFQGVSFAALMDSFRSINYWWVLPCLAVFYFGVWLRGWRWALLFRPKHRISVSRGTAGIFICFGFNSIFPARAGEFARAYLVGRKDKTGFSTAMGTVVAERLLDAVTLLGCLMIAMIVAPIDPEASMHFDIFGNDIELTGEKFTKGSIKAAILCAVLLAGVAFLSVRQTRAFSLRILDRMHFLPTFVRHKGREIIEKFAEGLQSLNSPGRAVGLIVLSFVIWLTNAASVMFLAWGFPFDQRIDLVQSFALVIITCIFIMVPAAPGYWGFLEAGVIFSIVIMGIHGNDALVRGYAILLHLTQWLPIVAIGLPLAWLSHVSLEEVAETAEHEGEAEAVGAAGDGEI